MHVYEIMYLLIKPFVLLHFGCLIIMLVIFIMHYSDY